MKCEKCGRHNARLVHDEDSIETTKILCNTCLGIPEFTVQCPHCEAIIIVN